MTLSRELFKRLNSEDYPLPKRLKLAEATFFAVDLPLMRKEDLLLDWLCKICITNQYAWKTLNNCLKSSYIDIKTNVRHNLVDTLIHTLNNHVEDLNEEFIETCSLVIAHNSMRRYFINKPKDLGLLVKALLSNVLKHSSCHNITQEHNQLPKLCELSPTKNCAITSILESIIQIYKRSNTKEELRMIFMHDILYSMCNIIDHTHTNSTNKLGVAAYKCIQQLLLGKSKCTQNKQTTESNQPIFSDLFCLLSANIETLSLQSNLLTYLFIFRAAIGTYKSDTVLLDAFFRNLINSSGKYKWEILNVSLKLLNDVTLDFENTIEGITLFEYFQKLISDVLTYDNLICSHYGVLAQLSYINPILIEKNISDILNKILMEEQTAEYTNLLIAVLHASTKLRREQKFISQLLITLRQHIAGKKIHKVTASKFFPHEFKIKLGKTINNMSTSQAIASLKTLIYYLNTDCMELLQCNNSCESILMLIATVELLVTLFGSMQIFEYTRALSAYEKFINALDELENVLSLLINAALCLSHNKNIIVILLTAVQSLSEMQNMLNYYVPKTVTKKVIFPILDEPWQQLIQRVSNFGEDNCKNIMNKLILHRLKLNISNETIKLHSLIGGLGFSWNAILRHNTDVLSLLNGKEISKVTYLLLADMVSNEKNFREWLDILDKECIQGNRYFVISLLSHILVEIGQYLSSGCTKSIIEHINTKLLMENGHYENNKLTEVLQVIKEQISQQQWVQMTNVISSKIELYLEILLHIPIIYFSPDVRTLIFLIVYSISKECEKYDKVSTLCNMIFSDLLEKAGIDIFQYIEPGILVNQLSRNNAFLKACVFSLRNVTTYNTLKSLVKSAQCKETMCVILECMEIVKPKLNTKQKIIFRKAEKKLAKAILKTLPEEIRDAFDVRCLISVLKARIPTEKITITLKKLTELTLQNIFTAKENSSNSINSILLQQGTQLASIVLQHPKTFEVQNVTIRNLWFIMLQHPCENLLKPLLAYTELKEFHEVLKLLYNKTINSLLQVDEMTWTNLFVIWSNIIKTDMNVKRNKTRFTMINNLYQTVQLLHIPEKYWSNLLHLSHDIISIKHLLIPNDTIDLIILINLKSLEKVKIMSCKNVLDLCGTLIKVRTNVIIDSLPTLLLLYRSVIKTITQASKDIVDKFDEHRFRCFAFDIEKLTGLLVKLKKDMVRLSPYLIGDLLLLFSDGAVPSYIKMALQNSVCNLISICDQHGIALLSRALPTSLQEIFKVQLEMYNKFYKYSGKV